MNLAVIGAGWVGLVTSAIFSDFGNKVWVVEINDHKIKQLSTGKIPFYEPGLDKLIGKSVQAGRLKFTADYNRAIENAEVIFVCIGTPNNNGEIDLSYLYAATKSIAKNLKKPAIVVIKSTVPPGINKDLEKWMKKFTKVKFDLASIPEFLREGSGLEDTLNPDRVVIGSQKKSVTDKLLELHQPISGQRLICDPTSAQMVKYAANAYLPVKISYANAIAVLCDKFGADVNKVMEGVGMDKRIAPAFFGAGLGYGGSCLPKDVAALVNLAGKVDYDFKILKAVQFINQAQIDYFIQKVVKLSGGSIKNKVMVVLGLAFKPGTSDMREARSIYVIEELKKQGAQIRACDPVAIPEAKKIISGVKFFDDPYKALTDAHALLLVTEWDEYRSPDFLKIKKLMKNPVIVDGRNVYNREKLEKLGFVYGGIGR